MNLTRLKYGGFQHYAFVDNVMKFMLKSMIKVPCPLTAEDFHCRPCPEKVGGHFVPDEGIVLCENQLLNEDMTQETMLHESIHAYDHCRADVQWEKNCRQHACSEIRAANLSGDCRILNEVARGQLGWHLAKHHQV